jgi:hypothetical protein
MRLDLIIQLREILQRIVRLMDRIRTEEPQKGGFFNMLRNDSRIHDDRHEDPETSTHRDRVVDITKEERKAKK